jgi:hypothetical protein
MTIDGYSALETGKADILDFQALNLVRDGRVGPSGLTEDEQLVYKGAHSYAVIDILSEPKSNITSATLASAINPAYYSTVLGISDYVLADGTELSQAKSLKSVLGTMNFGAGSKMVFLVNDANSSVNNITDTSIWLWEDTSGATGQPDGIVTVTLDGSINELKRIGTLDNFGLHTDVFGDTTHKDLQDLTSNNINVLPHTYVDPTLTCTCG